MLFETHTIDIYSSDSAKNKDGTTTKQRSLVAQAVKCSFQQKENKFLQNGRLVVVLNAKIYIKEKNLAESTLLDYLNKRKILQVVFNDTTYNIMYLKTAKYNSNLDHYTLVVEEVIK